MAEDVATQTDQTEQTAAEPTLQDVNYDEPTNVRSGRSETGVDVEDPEPTGTTEEEASEAGQKLAGRKRTLLEDLKTERKGRQDAEAKLQSIEERLSVYQSWDPIIQKLGTRPDLQQAVLDGKLTIAQAEAVQQRDREQDPELREIAEDFGWVKADGVTPDLDRASRYRDRHTRWAKQTAGEEVKPLAQTAAQQKALGLVETAVKYAEAQVQQHGTYADPAFVRTELQKAARTNPEWFESNEAANELYHRIVGRAFSAGKIVKGTARPATRTTEEERPEPDFVITEAADGKGGDGLRLTTAERKLGEQYGLSEKDWKLAEQHAGRGRGYTRLDED